MQISLSIRNAIVHVVIFSIAMGFMESAVVIYLREIYYPEGFRFPLVPISNLDSIVELTREAATMIMLMIIALLTGKNALHRFGFFLLAFAVWDLTYYIFLKAVLDWPQSILDWDILFLIPVPWFAPVLAPCLLAVLMIVFSGILILPPTKASTGCIRKKNWFWLITGSLIIIISFIYEYVKFILFVTEKNNSGLMLQDLVKFIPSKFNWLLFSTGFIMLVIQVIMIHTRIRKKLTHEIFAFE